MINFIKKNWKYIALILIILFLFGRKANTSTKNSLTVSKPLPVSGGIAEGSAALVPLREAAPVDTQDRLVIRDTSLSLVVKDVSKSIADIESKAKDFGGFLVNSYLSRPEEGGNGNIVIRVPEAKRAEALEVFRKMAVKVVSESIYGNDVTDEYVDLQSRLEVLSQTKIKFQEIMNRATAIADLLNIQRELINLQSQIDSVKGQQKYYEQSAKLSKITVYLSTDELSLPYAPTGTWRPAVIFKQATRSFVEDLRDIGTVIIWIFVYSPIIIPVVILIFYLRKRIK